MSEFYVDAGGLNGLYNQLVRASGDASDTLSYTQQHCDLPLVAQGFLMMVIGPHREAYNKLTGALTKLAEITQSAGTQVRRPKATTLAPTTPRPRSSTPATPAPKIPAT
jgi:hypothetical protein